jgi:hypothetical protein
MGITEEWASAVSKGVALKRLRRDFQLWDRSFRCNADDSSRRYGVYIIIMSAVYECGL